MREITIQNTKGIKKLVFRIPEGNGAYVLVGPNGSGKTSLLVCLDRINNPNAYATGFIAGRSTLEIDQYSNAIVLYKANNIEVKFQKKTARWAPTPKKGSSDLLKAFAFSETIFIRADSKRIDIKQEEIIRGDYEQADTALISSLNQIFETTRFSNLMRLKNRRRGGRSGSLFYVMKEGGRFYSEKRFSSGELALLRLVERLQASKHNSLILVDEAEMALHPRVQIKMYEYLKQKAAELGALIIIATHSASLIKATDKQHIICLKESANGEFEAKCPCYPAEALGVVDFERNTIFDYIFFVEDDMARLLLKKMINRFICLELQHSSAMRCIIPVGGYYQTALLAVNTKGQLFSQSQVFAILDADAFTDGIRESRNFESLYNENRAIVKNLGCTPEVWIVNQLETGDTSLNEILKAEFHCGISAIVNHAEYLACNASGERKRAKDKAEVLCSLLCARCGDSEDVVLNRLAEILVDRLDDGRIREICGPLFNARQQL